MVHLEVLTSRCGMGLESGLNLLCLAGSRCDQLAVLERAQSSGVIGLAVVGGGGH